MSQSEIDLRRRIADLLERLDAGASNTSESPVTMLLKTIEEDTYPTTAGAFYAGYRTAMDGTESEGSAATTLVDPGWLVYAYNLGSQVPPVGTLVLATNCGGRWLFRYDG